MYKVAIYQVDTRQFNYIYQTQIDRNYIVWGWDPVEQCSIYASPNTPKLLDIVKFDSNQNNRRKVKFESELAYYVLINSHLFLPLLRKISSVLIKHIDENIQAEQFISDVFSRNLYTNKPHFGRLGDKNYASTQSILNITKTILTDAKRIEHILTVYLGFYTLLNNYEQHSQLSYLFKKTKQNVYQDTLFKNRGKYRSRQPASVTTLFGIVTEQDKLPYALELHTRAVDQYRRDKYNPSEFLKEAEKKDIPFVAGPSGHTAGLLSAVLTLTKFYHMELTAEELQTFTLICAGFLIAAGAHSFHEVYSVAKQVGVRYACGDYASALPDIFIESKAFTELLQRYPEIIHHQHINNVSSDDDIGMQNEDVDASMTIDYGDAEPASGAANATPLFAFNNTNNDDRDSKSFFKFR